MLSSKERERERISYGIKVQAICQLLLAALLILKIDQICLDTFLFLHGIGWKRYNNVHLGIQQRTHGNFNRLRVQYGGTRNIVWFLQNYSETNAILLPGGYKGVTSNSSQLTLPRKKFGSSMSR